MKRLLEAVLVLAVLTMGAYVARQTLSRRGLARRPAFNPASRPGTDAEDPSAPPGPALRGVVGLPMVKLSRPAKPFRRAADVPPPAAPAP